MALVQTSISFAEFRNAFERYNRAANFSAQGLRLLYNYFEDFEENIAFDVVAICCDYCEMSIDDIIHDYKIDIENHNYDFQPLTGDFIADMKASANLRRNIVRDYLEENTCVIGETEEGFVFACF